VTLQYEGRSEHYSAGDVYTEPIGVVHRAINPHPDVPAAFVGFWVTAADRPPCDRSGRTGLGTGGRVASHPVRLVHLTEQRLRTYVRCA